MKLTSTLALLCLLPSLLIGCVDGDNIAPEDDADTELGAVTGSALAGASTDQLDAPKFLPRTCSAIADKDPNAADGEYTLYVDGDEARPWTAYCHNVWNGGAPFLSLQAGAGKNVAVYKAGGAASGTDVVTVYSKVRIDPSTLMIDISDQTFATSTGQLDHPGAGSVTSMPFGVAMACGGGIANANIDLSGTPFAVDGMWTTTGTGAAGGGTFSSDSKALDLWAEGFCGWTAPELAPFNPMNDAGDYALLVTYQP